MDGTPPWSKDRWRSCLIQDTIWIRHDRTLMSQVVSEWCEVVCWYKCATVRSCEQLLHWRRDSPSLTEGIPLTATPSSASVW